MWRGIIGGKLYRPGFYLVIDEDSKKVFCRGKNYHVSMFKKFLKEIDWKVPQVKIEARFVCAEQGFEENIGFQWSGIYNRCSSIKSKRFSFAGVGRPLSDINSNPKNQAAPSLIDWALNFLPTPSKISRAVSLPFVFGGRDLSTRRLNLLLNLAEDKNEIKTILKPTILTNDGDSAEILVGENVPIETIVEESIEGRLRNVKTADYKDIGIQLKVKPIVSPNKKNVYLEIFIENSQQSDSIQSSQTSYPVIRTTRSTTKVRLLSGQTTMISGLIKNVKEIYKTKAPFLGNLPIIGWLFRGSRRVKQDMQLLIFITPTVIE
jgi:general secretion pathway protein D